MSLLAALLLSQCASVINDGSQTFCGNKELAGVTFHTGSMLWNGRATSVFVWNDVVVGGTVRAMLENGLEFLSRRVGSDPGADFVFTLENQRDGGGGIVLRDGTPQHNEIIVLSNNGIIGSRCANNEQGLLCGGFRELNPMSGHVTLQGYPGLYLPVAGALGERTDAYEADGGEPCFDGGTWVKKNPDGGRNYYEYAGDHGEVTLTRTVARNHGWSSQARGSEFYTANDGTWGSNKYMTFDQFPKCPGQRVLTSLGWFFYEARVGSMATDSAYGDLYICKPWGWEFVK